VTGPFLALGLALAPGGCTPGADVATEVATGSDPDSFAFGHPDSVTFWTPEQQQAGFPNYHRIFPTRAIPGSSRPRPLPTRPSDLATLTYEMEGETLDLAGFFEHNHVEGLIVLKDGAVLLEEYAGDHTPSTPWVSYSVSKSVVSLLVGAAIRDGYIESVEDPVSRYVPLMEGSSYDDVPIRDLLRMSSGVQWPATNRGSSHSRNATSGPAR